jgi:hypothetical protein
MRRHCYDRFELRKNKARHNSYARLFLTQFNRAGSVNDWHHAENMSSGKDAESHCFSPNREGNSVCESQLTLTVSDPGAHTTLLATNLSSSLTGPLCSHEPIISGIQM